jgi:hypothetical protein
MPGMGRRVGERSTVRVVLDTANREATLTPRQNRIAQGQTRGAAGQTDGGQAQIGLSGGKNDKAPVDDRGFEKLGSASWTRTNDPLINSQLLYRLSYRGTVEGREL